MTNDHTPVPAAGMPSPFDRLIGVLTGLPDVLTTQPSTIQTIEALLGSAQTWIVQTYRHREQGDTIFLQCINAEGSFRLAVPAKVADAIARQRDALTAKARSKAARNAAADRKARGIAPAFMGKGKRAKKGAAAK